MSEVLVDARGGRPRVVGLVLAHSFEWDEDNGVEEHYVKVITPRGVVIERAWIGGPFWIEHV